MTNLLQLHPESASQRKSLPKISFVSVQKCIQHTYDILYTCFPPLFLNTNREINVSCVCVLSFFISGYFGDHSVSVHMNLPHSFKQLHWTPPACTLTFTFISSFFSCLKMLTLSFKFTIATQSCKMHFIFLQLGLVHESWFLLLQENCQLQEARMIRCSMAKRHKAKQTKNKQRSSKQTWPILWFILSSLGMSPRPQTVPFSLRETWISDERPLCTCVVLWLLLCSPELPPTLFSNCSWALHL